MQVVRMDTTNAHPIRATSLYSQISNLIATAKAYILQGADGLIEALKHLFLLYISLLEMPEALVSKPAALLGSPPVDACPQEPFSREDASRIFDQLAQLASSVPDLAATLSTQAEQDAEDANINFLRADYSDEDDSSSISSSASNNEASETRQRMRRAVDSMVEPRVYTPAQLQELGQMQETSTTNELPRPMRNREWAPMQYDRRPSIREYYGRWGRGGSDEEEEEAHNMGRSTPRWSARQLVEYSRELSMEHRREEHLQNRERIRQRTADELNAEAAGFEVEEQMLRAQRRQRRAEERGTDLPPVTESSLRTTVLLQTLRRNPQFISDRDELQRYILGRERGEDRDRGIPTRPNESSHATLSSQRRLQREATMRIETSQQRDLLVEAQQQRNSLQEQLQEYYETVPRPSENTRRRILRRPLSHPDTKSVDDAIRYLEQLRLCESDLEGQEAAVEGGFRAEVYSTMPYYRGFLINIHGVPPPPQSSFLRAGSVLSGIQHGTIATPISTYTPLMPPSIHRTRIANPLFGSHPPRNVSPARQSPPTNNETPAPPKEERWPVKVTIHSVDYKDMTLTGTMEASHVPDKTSPTKYSSITTYLEGEIIDFNTHTLETKSYNSKIGVDALYWRKLPPFREMEYEHEVVRKLLNQEWLLEELMQKWILMRWKGSSMFSLPTITRY